MKRVVSAVDHPVVVRDMVWRRGRHVSVPAGTSLVESGIDTDDLVMVISGHVSVTRPGVLGAPVEVLRADPGELVGNLQLGTSGVAPGERAVAGSKASVLAVSLAA